MLDAGSPPAFNSSKYLDGLLNAVHAGVVHGAIAAIDAIEKRSHIEQPGTRFEEELIQGTGRG